MEGAQFSMILTRRSFLTGILAAPIIVRPGILMPIRPLAPEPRRLIDMGRVGTNLSRDVALVVSGLDMYVHRMVERILPGANGQKFFHQITHINFFAADETTVRVS